MEKQGSYGIISDTIENFTLVKLIYTIGNIKNAVIIVDYCIFVSN